MQSLQLMSSAWFILLARLCSSTDCIAEGGQQESAVIDSRVHVSSVFIHLQLMPTSAPHSLACFP